MLGRAVSNEDVEIEAQRRRRLALRGMWLTGGLAAYGSLYPFGFAMPDGLAWEAFLGSVDARLSMPDVLGNVALFVPCAAFAMFAYARERRRFLAFAGVLAGMTALAFVVQALQVFVPGRVPSLTDVAFNFTGAVIGVGLAMVVERGGLPGFDSRRRIPIPLLLVGFWVFAELVPLVPSLDVDRLKDGLRPLLIDHDWSPKNMLAAASRLLAGAFLLRCVLSPRHSLKWLLVLVAALAVGKVVVISQELDLAVVTGWAAGFAVAAWLVNAEAMKRRAVVLAVLIGSYTFSGLHPYTLSTTLNAFHWVPFADLLAGSMLSNTKALLLRTFVFLVVLWTPGGRLVPMTVGLAVWVGMIELAQMALPGRTPSSTAPVLVVLLAWALAHARGARPR